MSTQTVDGSINIEIRWIDRGVEPQCEPDPRYPKGIDVDVSGDAAECCQASLPYPARRCGYYDVECRECGLRVMITTAGRRDDPRSIRLACKDDGGRDASLISADHTAE